MWEYLPLTQYYSSVRNISSGLLLLSRHFSLCLPTLTAQTSTQRPNTKLHTFRGETWDIELFPKPVARYWLHRPLRQTRGPTQGQRGRHNGLLLRNCPLTKLQRALVRDSKKAICISPVSLLCLLS